MVGWTDLLKAHGLSTLIAVVLLWFFLTGVAQAIKEHDASTRALLTRICIHTAVLAKQNPANCIGVTVTSTENP